MNSNTTGGGFAKFQQLKPADYVSQARIDSHRAAYQLLDKLIDHKTETAKAARDAAAPAAAAAAATATLREVNHQVVTAESLTGGLIFSTLANIPYGGGHKYGAFSVYDTDAKRIFLGVKAPDVYTRQCAAEMAAGALRHSNASMAIAVTGNAMPDQSNPTDIPRLG